VIDVVIAPPSLFATGTAEGTATHLGRFTATETAIVDLVTSTSTGTFNLTAANGDQLFATFVGLGEPIEPGISRLTEVATTTGGTGRFTAATGTFTMRRIVVQASGAWTGSLDGEINLNK